MLTTGISLAALILMPGTVERPDPTRYRMDVEMKNVADLTAAGMGEMASGVSATVWFQLTMSDSADGKIALITVDSLNYQTDGQAAMAFPEGLGAALTGSTLRAHVKDGKIDGQPEFSVPPTENPLSSLVSPAFAGLFAGIGSNSSRNTWADTTNSEQNSDAGSSVTETIATWTVTGRDGNLLLIDGTSSSTLSSTSAQGQEMSGTSESKVSLRTVAGGPAREASITSDQDMTVLNPALPAPIPVKVHNTLKLAQLP